MEGADAPEKTFYFALVPLNSADPEDEMGDGPYLFTLPGPNPLPRPTGGEGDLPVRVQRNLTFTNTYASQPALVTLNATKTALGKDMEPEQFSFVIYNADESGEPDGVPIRTGTNISGGDSSDMLFTPGVPFEYTQAGGPYYYLMEETGSDGAGWTLSKRQYLIRVDVTDDGEGNLSAAVTWGSKTPEDGAFPDEAEWEAYTENSGGSWPAFRNDYLAERLAEVPIMVRKSIAGIDETDRVFTFLIEQVADELGTALEPEDEMAEVQPPSLEITIAGDELEDGSRTKSFTLLDPDEKTYYFKLTEVDESDDEWSYDGRTYIVIVEVSDVDGQLVSTETYTVPGKTGTWEYANFLNTFETAGITFSFLKTDREGTALEGVEFALYACGETHTHSYGVTTARGKKRRAQG